MRIELNPCRKSWCWIPHLLGKGYHALWPLLYLEEKDRGYYVWNFYVKWTSDKGTHANKKFLCEKHHKQILAMVQEERALDVREQEVTEAWLTIVNSQMLTDL